MDELTNAIITVNLLPSNYNLHSDEENAMDKVVRAAINYNALSRTQPENKPLTLEELRLMDGLWVWIEASTWNGKHYSGWGKIIQVFPIVSVKIIEESPGYITEYDIGRHEAKFYAHKPKQEEK